MLPVIPAVLLMALQGVAGLEPSTHDARLSGAKRCSAAKPAVKQRSAESAAKFSGIGTEGAPQSVIAHRTLLGLLVQLLSIAGTSLAPAPSIVSGEVEARGRAAPRQADADIGQSSQGYQACRRTRDGPRTA